MNEPRPAVVVRRRVKQLIADRVPVLSRRFGVGAATLRSALVRTARHPGYWGSVTKESGKWQFEDLRFWPSPLRAVQVLRRDRAMALFAGEGLELLAKRLATLGHLLHPHTPFHTWSGLRSLTAE